MSIVISTDKEKLDLNFIHEFLTHSYWASGRTKEEVMISIKNTLAFGVYLDGKQIGFARILTDYIIFGYIMDVFIIEEYRGNGYSKLLMNTIMEHSDLNCIKTWMLATKDAHTLYQKFGFKAIDDPTKLMKKLVTK
ncbi:acetyltransferase (GNAT) family protein [Aquimarina sp. MAR_2010_214]|uniref:GNAT family N-acetyltransferase n=1 Tax=Aquimarina sp. MAR_2010_214 TaxID=1250026 RepID=UPI000C6FCF0F|nr:GNAT family N-acetyltransferase [Aquimarina sp. MAR_2010_214]PKV48211.1 acetyltransferase (GNAT) family protein [Aquimarina sp. MAR_2010_214]